MGPTEFRSRDEWLVEVKRRGGRLRRRRQVTFGVLAALALALPAGAMATFAGGQPHAGVELSVAGPAPAPGEVRPAPAGELAPAPGVTVGPAEPAPGEPAPGEPAGPTAPVTATTLAERPPPEAGPATTAATVPSTATDNVQLRPGATNPAPADPGGNTSSPVFTVPPPSAVPPTTTDPSLAPCPQAGVRVTVSTEKAAYAPGQVVHGSSVLENAGPGPCLLPTRAFFRVVNAAGQTVGSFAYTTDFRYPVPAEPGKTFTSTFSWDQRDCSGPACTQAPAGSYTAIADWSESGPYTGRGTFQVTS